MSVSENKALIRRYYEQWNKHDLIAICDFVAGSIREFTETHVRTVFTAFPDVQLALDELVAEGDRVLVAYTAQGTFTSPGHGLAPTGRMMTWQGMTLCRIANGVIAEWTDRNNFREVLLQTLEANKAILRRYIEEVVNQGHLERIPEFVAASYVEEKRRDEVAAFRAFPDQHASIEQMAAEGDLVMKRDTVTGTHQGEIGGFAPTGQKLSFSEITVDRVVDGKIAQWWGENNVLEVLQKAAAQKKVG
jgi:hypothetical protein